MAASDVFKKLSIRFQRGQSKVFSRRNMDNLAKQMIQIIRIRTKTGRGVTKSGQRYSLPGLSEGYKKARTRNRARLDTTTTASRSNLTATGQLLDSMRPKSVFGKLIIAIRDSRSTDLSGRASAETNSDIVGHQEKQNRRFFDLTRTERRELQRRIAKQLKDNFRR